MSEEQVRVGTPKSKRRLVVGLAAIVALAGLGAGAYGWYYRQPAPQKSEGELANKDNPPAESKVQPIPDQPEPPAAPSVLSDPYGSNRAFATGPALGSPRNAPVTPTRFDLPSPDETVVRGSDQELSPANSTASPPSTDPPAPERSSAFVANAPDLDPPQPAAERETRATPAPAKSAPTTLDNRLRQATRSALADNSDDSNSRIRVSTQESPAEPAEPRPSQFDPPATLQTPALAAPALIADSTPRETRPLRTSEPAGGGLGRAIPAARSEAPAATLPALRGSTTRPGASAAGEGVPGVPQLDGQQAPSLTIEKIAPSEIQVGRQATIQLKIRNVGRVAAHDTLVMDRVPKGTQLVNATPQFTQTPEGQLLWQLGAIQPGEESVVTMQLLPLAEGEIGSVAQVVFQAHASARSVCTKPELTLTHAGPQRVLIGEPVIFDITVTNVGSGAATGVVLEENVPEGLSHEAGRELEYEIGNLAPGQAKQLRLSLKAARAGQIENRLLVRGDANLVVKDSIALEVIAPALQVALAGPKLRYIEREATYEVSIGNPGTAPAKDIELVTYLPKGMKFVSADHQGQYEPTNHAVYWSLEELPPRQSGTAKVTVVPLQTGEQKLSLEARAELGLKEACEKTVQVESSSELQFTVTDTADPIEIGTETTYIVTLSNRGSSAATNIRLGIGLSPQLKPTGGDGPTRVVIQGGQIGIDPLARLAPGEQAIYKLKAQGLEAGSHRIQVQLLTAETPVPVTREEITKVYQDR